MTSIVLHRTGYGLLCATYPPSIIETPTNFQRPEPKQLFRGLGSVVMQLCPTGRYPELDAASIQLMLEPP